MLALANGRDSLRNGCGGHEGSRCGAGFTVFQCDPLPEAVQIRRENFAFHLYPICFRQLGVGVGNTVLERPMVRQNQQSFGIVIKPSGRIYFPDWDIIL